MLVAGLPPIEAFTWHRPLLARRGDDYDPRVRSRIERGGGMTAVEYVELAAARADLIAKNGDAPARPPRRFPICRRLVLPRVRNISSPCRMQFGDTADYKSALLWNGRFGGRSELSLRHWTRHNSTTARRPFRPVTRSNDNSRRKPPRKKLCVVGLFLLGGRGVNVR